MTKADLVMQMVIFTWATWIAMAGFAGASICYWLGDRMSGHLCLGLAFIGAGMIWKLL